MTMSQEPAAGPRLGDAVERTRQLDEFFRLALDILVVAGPAGHFVRVNPAMSAALGWSAQELTTLTYRELIHPDDYDRTVRELAAVSQGHTVLDFENRYRHKDGTWRTLQWRCGPRQSDGLVYATARDVTAQELLAAELQHAQRLDALGRMAGAVAHDFNNLLTTILGGLESAQEARPGGHAMAAQLQASTAAALRAAELTHALLAFARKQMVAPQVVAPNEVVRATRRLLEPLLGPAARLELALDAATWSIRVGGGLLEQVLLNLVANAADALAGPGTVTIGTTNARIEAAELGVGVPPGDWVRLRVADTGVGMTPEVRAHAFEPFFSTKLARGGTGLGLATVHGIVYQSGGHIRIESEPGEGTVVDTWWPAVPAAVAPAPAPPRRAAIAARRAVIVDDDAGVRDLVATTLRRAGLEVVAVDTGEAALEALRTAGDAVDLLVSDVVLPGRSGVAVAAEILAERPGLAVLLISGYADAADRDGTDLPEGARFLAKPFTPSTLLDAVADALGAGVAG